MSMKFVKALNVGNKSDVTDARAIWIVTQIQGKEVAVKSEAQQAVLALHRIRQQKIKFQTMQMNSLRGLLAEYGEVIGKSQAALDKAIPSILAKLSERLPAISIDSLRELNLPLKGFIMRTTNAVSYPSYPPQTQKRHDA